MSPVPSPNAIRSLGDEISVEPHCEALARDVDRRHHVRVLRLGRDQEPLAEDVEVPVASDEPDQVVAAGLWLRECDLRRALARREGERVAGEASAASGVCPWSRV